MSTAKADRGLRRLEIARKLLRLPEDADVLQRINALDSAARERLRGLVDWVEAYEAIELPNAP